jgi:hypothetical protein
MRVALDPPVARTNDAHWKVNFERNDRFPTRSSDLRDAYHFRARRPDARPDLVQ